MASSASAATPANLHLLLVEDDEALAAMLSDELRALGHEVAMAGDGREALVAVSNAHYDAVILDRLLPLLDGVSVLERMRASRMTTPVIMLTALGRSIEKVEGLEAGADDYVVKPVDVAELNARLHAVLRGRQWVATPADADTISAGDITVSPAKHRAWRDGKAVDLSKVELGLLAELARNADTVLTRAMLYERVWGYDFEPSTNIIDAQVRRLRIKLTEHGGSDPIVTIRGVGYMLRG